MIWCLDVNLSFNFIFYSEVVKMFQVLKPSVKMPRLNAISGHIFVQRKWKIVSYISSKMERSWSWWSCFSLDFWKNIKTVIAWKAGVMYWRWFGVSFVVVSNARFIWFDLFAAIQTFSGCQSNDYGWSNRMSKGKKTDCFWLRENGNYSNMQCAF